MEKNVLILGYGISGKSSAKAAINAGYAVTIFDEKITGPKEHQNSKGFNFIYSITEVLTREYDYVVKSPGIPPYSNVIKALKEKGIKIISDLEWGYILKGDSKIITVTGTNGKTTTTILIDMIMKAGGYTTEVAGNIGRGAPEIMQKSVADYIIIEASSFQLMDIDKYRSDITVLTNITSDHLDYHKTRSNYVESKLKILKNLLPTDPVVINCDDELLRDLDYSIYCVSAKEKVEKGLYLNDGIIYNKNIPLLDTSKIKMVGLHNYYNIMEAIQVGLIHGIDRDTILDAIKDFPGVEHRLEYVTTKNGVKYYNDSKATNTISTLYALDSFDENIVLILGGYDKKESYAPVVAKAKDKVKKIIAIGETKEKILNDARATGYDSIVLKDNLVEAMEYAKKITEPKDVVLLSPASASWGMYNNFEERGRHFKSLI